MNFEIKRGSSISIPLEITDGDIADAIVTATLKRAKAGAAPGDAAVAVATFTVVAVDHVDPDDVSSNPGWLLGLTADQTAALRLGDYVFDARLVADVDEVVMAPTQLLTVVERVTEPLGG